MKEKKKISPFSLLIIIALVIALALALSSCLNLTKQISYADFENMIVKKTYGDKTNVIVSDIKIVGSTVFVRLDDSKITIKDFNANNKGDYYFVISTNAGMQKLEDFIKEYNAGTLKRDLNDDGVIDDSEIVPCAKQVEISYDVVQESWLSRILPYASLILIGILGFWIIRTISGAGKGTSAFGKSKARLAVPSKVKFADVAGAKEEKFELQEIVEFLKNPKKFTDLGARIPKGVILVGPPGTGKTMLAKAVAGESNVPFFKISGSDFVEMFVGVGASRVRDLFDQAKKNAPAIIFIDEIDAVGRQRGTGLGGGNDEREQTLNQLLVEMDGFETNEGIIVMAATNRPDVLDPALLRPGRFDRQIYVNMPDVGEREEILLVHAKNKKFTDDVNFKNIARITTGFSGADLENLLNEAAILAARDNRPRITNADLNAASTKVMMGPQKKSKTITEKDRKITAYHEAGHAILHKLLPYCDEVQEVSIVPRGMAGGYTMSRPENDESYASFNKLNNMIASMMGGRIAEEIIFGDITTGASNDIEQATKLARKMVTQFGMSARLGFINLGSSSEVFIGRDYQNTVLYSEDTAKTIDSEMEQILKKNYSEAKQLLLDNIDKLHALADLLLKRETVFQEEVDMLMKGVDNKTIIRKMNLKENKQKKELDKERVYKKEKEEEQIRVLQEKAFNALQQEGIIPKDVKFEDTLKQFEKNSLSVNDVKIEDGVRPIPEMSDEEFAEINAKARERAMAKIEAERKLKQKKEKKSQKLEPENKDDDNNLSNEDKDNKKTEDNQGDK